jgi:hypothetical protein
MVSGMGTPDLRGGYGSFTLFTTDPKLYKEGISAGKIIPVAFHDHKFQTQLPGPANNLETGSPETKIPMNVWRDPQNPVVLIEIQNQKILLKQGEWTDWFQLSFPILQPFYDVKGICKFFLKSVHPHFTMYVSPINIDPLEPALPVVTSRKYAEGLVNNVGYFYTQGFPEDTKALSEGVLGEEEYLALSYQILSERKKLLDYELRRFSKQNTGMLFFYFSSIDQNSHMYWRTMDPYHPLYNEDLNRKYGDTLKKLYVEMDQMLGQVLEQNDIDDPNFTLMVMSDHGFAPFRRQVNVNNWLSEMGYLGLSDSRNIENKEYFGNVIWSKTAAYNLGINSVYLNIRGREKRGIVIESEAKKLREKIGRDLLNLVDPNTGKKAVSRVWIVPEEERRRHSHAPDLVVGWSLGYRSSWESILGGFSRNVFSDNPDKWSGDHCIDPDLVPAILFCNKKITKRNPKLYDITATILEQFGIAPENRVQGKSLLNT